VIYTDFWTGNRYEIKTTDSTSLNLDGVSVAMTSVATADLERIAIDYPIRFDDVLMIYTITGNLEATRRFAQLTQLGYAMHEIKQRAMRMYHTLPEPMDYDSGMEAQWQEGQG
jgi:hypothetical protein